MNFPTTFSEELTPLSEMKLDERGERALGTLAAKGFEVVYGVRRDDVPVISRIARQRAVREFCPKDATERFPDVQTMEEWLGRDDTGCAFFLLRAKPHAVPGVPFPIIVGPGWIRPKGSNFLPDCNTTFALRVSSDVKGYGLGVPFTEAMVSATANNFDGVRGIGLDTWQSNFGAVKTYKRSGAVLVAEELSKRITLGDGPIEEPREISDVRLHMQFTQTLGELSLLSD